MMVFKRIRDVAMAVMHEWMDDLEEPVMMVKQYIRDMEAEIKKAEHAVANQKMLANKFQRQADEAREFIVKRVGQAQLAVEAGKEDLARQALHSKLQYEEQVKQYEQLLEEAKVQEQELLQQLQEMKERYQLLKDRKRAMTVKAETAKTKKSISDTFATFDYDRIIKGFSQIEDKIAEMEYRTKLRNTSESYVNQMTKMENEEAIEAELQKLKA